MMRFSGTLPAREYAWAVVWRIGIFVGVTLLFPLALFIAVKSTRCSIDTCGAVALVYALLSKPIIYLIFALSFLPITVRRLRDAGLPLWYAAAIFVVLLADVRAGTAMGALWSVNFVLGFVKGPSFMLSALVCMAALCLMGRDAGGAPMQPWQRLLSIAFIVATMLALYAIAEFPYRYFAGGRMTNLRPVLGAFYPFVQLPRLALVAAPALLAWMAVRSWRAEGAPGSRSPWFYLVCLCSIEILASLIVGLTMAGNYLSFYLTGERYLTLTKESRVLLARFAAVKNLVVLLLPLFLALMQRAGGRGAPSEPAPPASGSPPRSGPHPATAASFGRRARAQT